MPGGKGFALVMDSIVDDLLADDPKLREAYEATAKRCRRLVNRWRNEGITDMEIGVLLGGYFAQFGPNMGPLLGCVLAREMGETP